MSIKCTQTSDQHSARSPRRVPPALLLVTSFISQRVLAQGSRPSRASVLGAIPIAAASTYLLAGSVRQFTLSRTTVNPVSVDAASSLVREGPNQLTRNPMYLGMAGLLISHAVLRRHPMALMPAAAFVGWIDFFQIRVEEAALAKRFPEYEEYRAKTPRWL